jgi:hypothetical protein
MSFAVLWSPAWTGGVRPAPELLHALLARSPNIVATGDLVWIDARGLAPRRLARHLLEVAREIGTGAPRLGLSRVALVAEIAARHGTGRAITAVAPGAEGTFLATHPLTVLETATTVGDAWTPRLAAALADVGLVRCGDLAALTLEAVEVRFGVPGIACWRLVRGENPRHALARFAGRPRELPAASLAWTGYELHEAARLVFVANRLAERICDDLLAAGTAARSMTLRFALAGGGAVERLLRGARPTADRATWLRLVRADLDRLAPGDLPDGVVGLGLRVDAASGRESPQGDVFDSGFQTGAAAEAAMARLLDSGFGEAVVCEASGHPLPERRARRRTLGFAEVAQTLRSTARLPDDAPDVQSNGPPSDVPNGLSNDVPNVPGVPLPKGVVLFRPRGTGRNASSAGAPAVSPPEILVPEPLAFRTLPAPRRVVATTRLRQGARAPVTYRERTDELTEDVPNGEPNATRPRRTVGQPLVGIVAAAGPDRVVTGHETGEGVVREYWQCATDEGRLVLLYREGDAAADAWYLQGWWD